MALTVAGRALMNSASGNGRYSRTFRTPTFAPPALSQSTASCAISAPLPIMTITRSASRVSHVVDQAGTSGRRRP